MTIRIVTVGIDRSLTSRVALDWVIERARHTPTQVGLVTVVPVPPPGLRTLGTVRTFYEENVREAADFAKQAAIFKTVSSMLTHGDPSERLMEASSFTDILVVGTDRHP
ncbi:MULTISPECIES: universal stress protein [Bacteria]|jgi:nucleotide-binding universal stress UspA family protein